MNVIGKYLVLPVALLSLHWVLTQTYATYCVPASFSGYMLSFFTAASPICAANLTLLTKTGELYAQSWLLLTFWSVGLIGNLYRSITAKFEDGQKK
jgi:hypothetical protein